MVADRVRSTGLFPMQTSTDFGEVRPLYGAVGKQAQAKPPDRANARPTLGEGSALNERTLAKYHYHGNSITDDPGRYRMTMTEPETGIDWLRLERDVGRLFSAAPLCAVGS